MISFYNQFGGLIDVPSFKEISTEAGRHKEVSGTALAVLPTQDEFWTLPQGRSLWRCLLGSALCPIHRWEHYKATICYPRFPWAHPNPLSWVVSSWKQNFPTVQSVKKHRGMAPRVPWMSMRSGLPPEHTSPQQCWCAHLLFFLSFNPVVSLTTGAPISRSQAPVLIKMCSQLKFLLSYPFKWDSS